MVFAYTDGQMQLFFQAIHKYSGRNFGNSSYYKDRDVMMIKFSYYLGLRLSEVASAHVSCIDFKNNVYAIYSSVAKKGSGGLLPIPLTFFDELIDYINKYNLKTWLFLSRTRKGLLRKSAGHISFRGVGFRFGIYRKIAGLDFVKDYSTNGHRLHLMRFHDLRGTIASKLEMAGVRYKIIQNLLRHKHFFSTCRYLADSKFDDRVDAVNKVFN